MSEIRTELDRIISQVEEGHSKATAKGATPQSSKTLANLLTAIETIPEASEPTLQSKTVSPSTSAQTVKPDSGYDGLSQVTVEGDADLIAENIKSGVSIFGVAGSYEGSGGESGGNSECLTMIGSGTFTGDGETEYNLYHGLNTIPKAIRVKTSNTSTTRALRNGCMINLGGGTFAVTCGYFYSGTSTVTMYNADGLTTTEWTDTNAVLYFTSNAKFVSDAAYTWYAYA